MLFLERGGKHNLRKEVFGCKNYLSPPWTHELTNSQCPAMIAESDLGICRQLILLPDGSVRVGVCMCENYTNIRVWVDVC